MSIVWDTHVAMMLLQCGCYDCHRFEVSRLPSLEDMGKLDEDVRLMIAGYVYCHVYAAHARGLLSC